MCINLQLSSLDGGTGGTSRPPLVVQQCLRPGRTLSPWTLHSSAIVDICLLSVLPYCAICKVRDNKGNNKVTKGRIVKSKRLFSRFGFLSMRVALETEIFHKARSPSNQFLFELISPNVLQLPAGIDAQRKCSSFTCTKERLVSLIFLVVKLVTSTSACILSPGTYPPRGSFSDPVTLPALQQVDLNTESFCCLAPSCDFKVLEWVIFANKVGQIWYRRNKAHKLNLTSTQNRNLILAIILINLTFSDCSRFRSSSLSTEKQSWDSREGISSIGRTTLHLYFKKRIILKEMNVRRKMSPCWFGLKVTAQISPFSC